MNSDEQSLSLASVLTLENGEIKPRHDWREYFQSLEPVQPPRINYFLYERWCEAHGRKPDLSEWLDMHGIKGEL